MSSEPVTLDRRRRRHLETVEEALDVAEEIMVEQGVAGLSAGEVARRLGMRPPSLYVYFPSKNALYDALFERGARAVLAEARACEADLRARLAAPDGPPPLTELLLDLTVPYVRWCVQHPAATQLLFWRPVPGYAPSPQAYGPAVQMLEELRALLGEMCDRGLFRAGTDPDDLVRDLTCLSSGVVSQQLSNAPGESYEEGRFTAAVPSLVAMFAAHHGAAPV